MDERAITKEFRDNLKYYHRIYFPTQWFSAKERARNLTVIVKQVPFVDRLIDPPVITMLS